MAELNASNVSFGKPKATGGIYYAPAGTTVPTDATTPLNEAFKNLGYISEDGLVNSVSTDTENITAWGGDTVASAQTGFEETFQYNLLETSVDALKHYYGDSKVNVDEQGNITVTQSGEELPEMVVVAEMVLTGGRVKRVVIPKAKIADRSGDITYTDGDAITLPVTLTALPFRGRDTHIEYIAATTSK